MPIQPSTNWKGTQHVASAEISGEKKTNLMVNLLITDKLLTAIIRPTANANKIAPLRLVVKFHRLSCTILLCHLAGSRQVHQCPEEVTQPITWLLGSVVAWLLPDPDDKVVWSLDPLLRSENTVMVPVIVSYLERTGSADE